MESSILQFVEIEKALNLFNGTDFYNAAIGFFKAMDFHVTSIQNAAPSNPAHFIYSEGNIHAYFSKDERALLRNVESMFLLFKLKADDKEYLYIDTKKIGNRYINGIVVVAAKIKDSCLARSEVVNSLTLITSKIFTEPVFMIFIHKSSIAFSGHTVAVDNAHG